MKDLTIVSLLSASSIVVFIAFLVYVPLPIIIAVLICSLILAHYRTKGSITLTQLTLLNTVPSAIIALVFYPPVLVIYTLVHIALCLYAMYYINTVNTLVQVIHEGGE